MMQKEYQMTRKLLGTAIALLMMTSTVFACAGGLLYCGGTADPISVSTTNGITIGLMNYWEIQIANHSSQYVSHVLFDCISEDGSTITHYGSRGDIRVGGWSPGFIATRQMLSQVAKECTITKID